MAYAVEATESATRPFCVFDKVARDYARQPSGLILTFKTRDAAAKFMESKSERV
jgi:hypothetical protein